VREDHAAEQALECLSKLETKSLEAKRDALRRRIRTLEVEGKIEEALLLMNELDRSKRPSSIV
jgi:hypothetical protein